MTAAVALDLDFCPACAEPRNLGLCSKDACRKQVLPQLSKPALVRLIGDSLTEQTKAQNQPLSPSEKAAVERIGRRNARKRARSGGGYFGLAKAILGGGKG